MVHRGTVSRDMSSLRYENACFWFMELVLHTSVVVQKFDVTMIKIHGSCDFVLGDGSPHRTQGVDAS